MTEITIRFRVILLQVYDLRFNLATTAASSLEMYCNLFSKSSPCNLKIPFQTRERIPRRCVFFLSLPSAVAAAAVLVVASLFSPSPIPLSSAIFSPSKSTDTTIILTKIKKKFETPNLDIGSNYNQIKKKKFEEDDDHESENEGKENRSRNYQKTFFKISSFNQRISIFLFFFFFFRSQRTHTRMERRGNDENREMKSVWETKSKKE